MVYLSLNTDVQKRSWAIYLDLRGPEAIEVGYQTLTVLGRTPTSTPLYAALTKAAVETRWKTGCGA